MPTRGALKRALGDWTLWFGANAETARQRTLATSVPKGLALALVGVRRGGKTFMSLCMSRTLVARTFYFNFEDPVALDSDSPALFDLLLELWEEEHGAQPHRVILDEAQQVPHWERWVRKAVDLGRAEVVITGSSSRLLSSELATSVTGRALERHVWPLSYPEYLAFTGQHPESDPQHRAALQRYLRWGGFPKPALTSDDVERTALLKQYLQDIVMRDVSHRHAIRDGRKLDKLVSWYLTNVSCLHSYQAIRKAFGLSTETAAEYSRYLAEAFLFFEVQRYHPNLKVQARDPKKVYVVDTGLRTVSMASDRLDWGRLAENAVYIELRRRGHTVTYFKKNRETDFVVTELGKPVDAIQVAYGDLIGVTREREIMALLEATRALGLTSGRIVTRSEDDRLRIDGIDIELISLHRWLLQPTL